MSKTIHNNTELISKRKSLRKRQTIIEGFVWKYLKQKQLGSRVRRQHSIGPYIVDFYCARAKLVIELDGSYHQGENQINYDQKRTTYLESLNLRVLRYTSYQVLHELDSVISDIREQYLLRTTSPSPSSTEEGN